MKSLMFEVGLTQCFDKEATLRFKKEKVSQMPKVLWVESTGSVSAVTGADGRGVGNTISGKANKPSPLTNL